MNENERSLTQKGIYFRNPFKWISRTGRTNIYEKNQNSYCLRVGEKSCWLAVKGHGNLSEVRVMLCNFTVIWVTQEYILAKTHLKYIYDMCMSLYILFITVKKGKKMLRKYCTLANDTHAEMFCNEVYQFL